MAMAISERSAVAADQIKTRLTAQRVKNIVGNTDGLSWAEDEVQHQLPRLRDQIQAEAYRHLMPGPVRSFLENITSQLKIFVSGDLDSDFALVSRHNETVDVLLPLLEVSPGPTSPPNDPATVRER